MDEKKYRLRNADMTPCTRSHLCICLFLGLLLLQHVLALRVPSKLVHVALDDLCHEGRQERPEGQQRWGHLELYRQPHLARLRGDLHEPHLPPVLDLDPSSALHRSWH